ncbi:unnamed protein product [Phytophthora fragariaefolia]|uniref:Unnamed protein product n=1 Tax=Phytophthora fragariaefolia TaxID=1490495 RepID=A0A9W6Y345_9STRA|nr:unnamed protein product [Phytophthora fragariaefolia]
MVLTPQQTRNIIQQVLGSTTVDRARVLLDTFVQVEGYDVLLVQDQMDITCIIAMQTAVQKSCFKQWGDSLVMDWTHGTNNLGYHLGSLVVTSATGRGIPVVDFLALDQKAETMQLILDFFKRHNPTWTSLQLIKISLNGVCWIRHFPKPRSYCASFMLILIGARFAEDRIECPELLKYFMINWKTWVSMWANHSRGKYFSAGNTTTNRIESNWNQAKHILRKRPRLDATLSGLLAHQGTIVRQILTTVRKHVSTSRQQGSIPDFFIRVSKRLSDAPLLKVRTQWDLFMVYMDNFTCLKLDGVGEWEVSTRGCSFCCNDFEWSCTCLFYCSHHLPCQHLMYIAEHVHHFDYLPESSVTRRWDMLIASDLEDEFQNGVNALQIVQTSMKEAAKTWTHDGLTQHHVSKCQIEAPQAPTQAAAQAATQLGETTKNAPKHRRVIYVKMRSRERANIVVLSSEEKYCYTKAVFEPVMEQLSGLTTPAFLTTLNSWKEIVSKRLHAGASENSTDTTTRPNEDNETDSVTSDDKSDVSPADLIDSMNFIRDIEQAVQLPITSTAGSSSETTDTIQKTQREEKRANLAVSWNSRSSNTDLAKTPAMVRVAHSSTEYVCSAEYDYHFVIPKCLVVKLDAVVKAEKNKRPKSTYFNSTSSLDPPDGTTEETIAYFLGGTPRFTRFVRIPCFLFRCLASVALNVAPANLCVA